MTSKTSALTHARLTIATRLVEAYHFPVIPIGQTSKRPVVRWTAFQSRLPTADELAAWFADDRCNLGIVTGAISGLVVIDLDDDEARWFASQVIPATPMRVVTGRGGVHLYFRHPGVLVRNRVGVHPADYPHPIALDVRGDGGFVVGPGSVHAVTGQTYRAPERWPSTLAAVPIFDPQWVREAIREPIRTPPRVLSSSTPIVERARAYLAAVPVPEIGAGSDHATYVAAARLVRDFGVPTADAEDLLWNWCGQRDGWTRDWVAAKVRHAAQYGTAPIGGLR